MSIKKTIIEQLNNMASVALKPEDQERWGRAMEALSKELDCEMEKNVEESLLQISGYNGSDFIFDRSTAPIAPGTIAYFKLGNLTHNIPAYVSACHEYSGKWKYDLTIAVMQDDGWHTTRIYNVESKWLTQL